MLIPHCCPSRPQNVTHSYPKNYPEAAQRLSKSPKNEKPFLKFGVRADLCDYPPRLIIGMPKFDNAKTENLTPEQIEQFLYAIDTDYEQNMCLMMKLALCTGIRRGALFGLSWRDLDFERGFIVLDGATAKSGKAKQSR